MCSEGATTGHQPQSYLGRTASQVHTPFNQQTQPLWWRPKGMAAALYNSNNQAALQILICIGERKEKLSLEHLHPVVSQQEDSSKNQSSSSLSWSEFWSDHPMLPELGHQFFSSEQILVFSGGNPAVQGWSGHWVCSTTQQQRCLFSF